MFDLSGRVALVTGASRGIGKAIATAFVRSGAEVSLVSRREAAVHAAAKEVAAHGREVHPIVGDVGDVEDGERIVMSTLAAFGRLDILVNNAAVSPFARMADQVEPAAWDMVVNTNLRGTFFLTQHAARPMMQAGYGRVINVTSVLAGLGLTRSIPYSPAKAALTSLTQCLAADWGRYGITVNAIAPGFIETDMNALARRHSAFNEAVKERVTLHRWGDPSDVAPVAVFLASTEGAYVTGVTVPVDGGLANAWDPVLEPAAATPSISTD